MSELSRRQLLRTGGLALSFGTLAAACGSGRTGSTDPGRLGVADTAPTLPTATVNDAVVLRTLQSIHYTALEVFNRIGDNGGLPDNVELADRALADHQRHADELGALAVAAGGTEYACANPFFVDRLVDPAFEAVSGTDKLAETDDVKRDMANIANAFQDWVGRCCQDAVAFITDDLSLRTPITRIMGEVVRLSAALAGKNVIAPILLGEEAEIEEFPITYALPGTFGQVTGVELIVGAVTDEGTRTKLQLQTAANNAYQFDSLACS